LKVTLIYCGIGVAGFNADRPTGDREGSWIAHGIASVGSSTAHAGHEVDLIDLRQLGGWDDLANTIKKNPAEVYGLSVSPVDEYSALQTIYEIKLNVPHAKIIVGGIHPTVFPEKYAYQVVDTVVQGEGEVTFPKLLADLDNLPKVIQGEKPDLDEIPWVNRDLFQYHRELVCNFTLDQGLPSITMLAGRGCPYQCNYCQPAENAVFGKPFRIRSVNNVMAELHYLHRKYKFKSITFWDDTFTFDRRWIMDFCENYNLPATIAACSRADIICAREDMVRDLACVGVDWLVIGMESGSQRLLDLIKKGTTVEQNLKAREICARYGIKVFATFMLGLPTETPEESDQTLQMIYQMQPEHVSPFWYTPIPGTGLYDFCCKKDLILPEAKEMTIERTGRMVPRLRGVDYSHLECVMGAMT
jgi:anaerobic magnesium-protoporphyrin IX monomethyl ester cyclase